jgi:O-antigen ligase
MKPEHMIALAMIPAGVGACAIASACFDRVRDILFFAMVSLAVFAERIEVNFFSEAWYRGTTRGLQVTVVEILAAGVLFGCIARGRTRGQRAYWPGSLGLLLLFFLYCCVSVIIAQPKVFGGFELTKMFAGVVIFLSTAAYARTRREWTILAAAVASAVAFEGVWAIKQHFLISLDRAAGTLDHPNSLSMYFCLTAPLLVSVACAGWSRGLKFFCGLASVLAAVAVLLTFSRAGVPVFAVVVGATVLACISWRLTTARVLIRTLMIAGAVAITAACWSQLERRYAEATFEEEYMDTTVDGRGVYLRLAEAIAKDHFFGVGLNNWSYYVSRTYGERLGYRFVDYDYLNSVYGTSDDKLYANSYLAAPAHNLGALTLGELGIPGFLIFSALWIRWISMGVPFLFRPRDEPMRVMAVGILFGICGIFGQSMTEWVFRQTPIFFTFLILMGALAALARARRVAPAPDVIVADRAVVEERIEEEMLVTDQA